MIDPLQNVLDTDCDIGAGYLGDTRPTARIETCGRDRNRLRGGDGVDTGLAIEISDLEHRRRLAVADQLEGEAPDQPPVDGLVHKYEMGLLYVVSTCSAHCRFCYREELISQKEVERQDGSVAKKGLAKIPEVTDYIKAHNKLVEENGGRHPETECDLGARGGGRAVVSWPSPLPEQDRWRDDEFARHHG